MSHIHVERPAALAILVIAVISGLIPALQATLLPQLVKEGRLTLPELGQVAMAEAIGTVLAVSIANAALKPERLRWLVVACAIIGLSIDITTPRLTSEAILAVRFAHGLCAGVLLWVWVGFLTRCDNPARWIAIYVTAQAATLLVLTSWFSTTLLPQAGALAGFALVAGLYGLIGLLAVLVPKRYDPLGYGGGSTVPTFKGWIGLFAVSAQIAAILAMWVYIKPYGEHIGLNEATTGFAVAAAMGSQILAGLLAAALAGRVRAGPLILFVAAASVASLVALLISNSAITFIVATTAFAFLWMLGPPFHMPYLNEIDPSRRSALHMATAQLLGIAVGPALASMAVDGDNVTGAFLVAAALYATGGLIVAATAFGRKAEPNPPAENSALT